MIQGHRESWKAYLEGQMETTEHNCYISSPDYSSDTLAEISSSSPVYLYYTYVP